MTSVTGGYGALMASVLGNKTSQPSVRFQPYTCRCHRLKQAKALIVAGFASMDRLHPRDDRER